MQITSLLMALCVIAGFVGNSLSIILFNNANESLFKFIALITFATIVSTTLGLPIVFWVAKTMITFTSTEITIISIFLNMALGSYGGLKIHSFLLKLTSKIEITTINKIDSAIQDIDLSALANNKKQQLSQENKSNDENIEINDILNELKKVSNEQGD